jgi:hypothetical protein
MSKFSNWWQTNSDYITWWMIGWLSWGCLDALARGNYGLALLDVVLIGINYKLWKK